MENSSIGQLSKKAEVDGETDCHYEGRGLIPEPPRCKSGCRQYSPDAAAGIPFIRYAKELGFSIEEISGLLFYPAPCRIPPSSAAGMNGIE